MPFIGYGFEEDGRTIVSSFYSMQESAMEEPNYFAKRLLEFEGLRSSFGGARYFNEKDFVKSCHLAEKTATTFSAK